MESVIIIGDFAFVFVECVATGGKCNDKQGQGKQWWGEKEPFTYDIAGKNITSVCHLILESLF